MVKIAYCLYGQPRNFLEGFKNIKKFVENYDVDFYYHTWTLSSENENYTHSQYRNVSIEELKYDKDIINKINLLYNPKAFLYEESRIFNFENDNSFVNSIAYSNTPDFNKINYRISNTLSNFYSKQQVRNLLCDTIDKYQLDYHFVITSRFDFLNEININLDNIENEKIYVSNIYNPRYIFSDAILLSNVENYLKLFNLYDNLSNLINNKEINNLVESYNEKFIIVAESLLFANYLYIFKDFSKIEYINFPNFV
jgi:hypothetical protein